MDLNPTKGIKCGFPTDISFGYGVVNVEFNDIVYRYIDWYTVLNAKS